MTRLRGKALLPLNFTFRYILPQLLSDPHRFTFLGQQVRKYWGRPSPDREQRVSFIALRVNEVCNLRCKSCGQWGENGHLVQKLTRGEKLDALDFDVVKKVVEETLPDRPFYYVWGGEPTLWKPLQSFFETLSHHGLHGSIVSNAHALEPMIERLIGTGALKILFLSLDGWDEPSHSHIRSSTSQAGESNFVKTMKVIEKVATLKAKQGLQAPLVIPITVISSANYHHLVDIYKLVQDTTELHPFYYGWYITPERAALHEQVFQDRFGTTPTHHRGYLKSCFNDMDAKILAEQVAAVQTASKGRRSVPQFFPDLYSEQDIARYYSDHAWDCGYPRCESIYHVAEISPDGRMTPCRDYQDYTAGNINTESFYSVWNGSRFKKFRRAMQQGLMPVCTRCCGLQGF